MKVAHAIKTLGAIGVLAPFISSTAFATERKTTEAFNRISESHNTSSSLTEATYSQSIDHFGQLAGQTFAQRYRS